MPSDERDQSRGTATQIFQPQNLESVLFNMPTSVNTLSFPTAEHSLSPSRILFSRRNFIKTLAAVTGATILSQYLGESPAYATAPPSREKKVRRIWGDDNPGNTDDLKILEPTDEELRKAQDTLFLKLRDDTKFDLFIGTSNQDETIDALTYTFQATNNLSTHCTDISSCLNDYAKEKKLFKFSSEGFFVSDEQKALTNSFRNGFAVSRIVFGFDGSVHIVGHGKKPVASITQKEWFWGLFKQEIREVNLKESEVAENSTFVISMTADQFQTRNTWGGSADILQSENISPLDYPPTTVANIIASMQEGIPNKTENLTGTIWPRAFRDFYFYEGSTSVTNNLNGPLLTDTPPQTPEELYIVGHRAEIVSDPSSFNFDKDTQPVHIPIGSQATIDTILVRGGRLLGLIQLTDETRLRHDPDGSLHAAHEALTAEAFTDFDKSYFWIDMADFRLPIVKQ